MKQSENKPWKIECSCHRGFWAWKIWDARKFKQFKSKIRMYSVQQPGPADFAKFHQIQVNSKNQVYSSKFWSALFSLTSLNSLRRLQPEPRVCKRLKQNKAILDRTVFNSRQTPSRPGPGGATRTLMYRPDLKLSEKAIEIRQLPAKDRTGKHETGGIQIITKIFKYIHVDSVMQVYSCWFSCYIGLFLDFSCCCLSSGYAYTQDSDPLTVQFSGLDRDWHRIVGGCDRPSLPAGRRPPHVCCSEDSTSTVRWLKLLDKAVKQRQETDNLF